MRAEYDGLDELVVVFRNAARLAAKDVDGVVKRGAQNVKTQMAAEAAASRHFASVAPAISYDAVDGLGSVGYEVGPDKSRAGGALGNIAYFGGVNGGGGTLDIDGPLAAEEPRLLKALGDLAEGLL